MRAIGLTVLSFFAMTMLVSWPQAAYAARIEYTLAGNASIRLHHQGNPVNSLSATFGYDSLIAILDTDLGTLHLSGTSDQDRILNSDGDFFGVLGHFTVDAVYGGLSTGVDPVTGTPFDAIGRSGSTLDGSLVLQTSNLGRTPIPLDAKFAEITSHTAPAEQQRYAELVDSGPLSMVLGFLQGEGGSAFHAWYMSSGIVHAAGGNDFLIEGDFDALVTGQRLLGETEIPEPLSGLLLGSGILGAGLLRRRQERGLN